MWAEFERSEWTDARALGVANTLDSGVTHLVIAPIVALMFGGTGSFAAQFTCSSVVPDRTLADSKSRNAAGCVTEVLHERQTKHSLRLPGRSQ